MKLLIWEHAVAFRPSIELLLLKSLEAITQLSTESVVLVALTHEADPLAGVKVEFDVEPDKGWSCCAMCSGSCLMNFLRR